MVSPETLKLADFVAPLRENPERSAVLIDLDGTLAPIVMHAQDAHISEPMRRPLIDIAKRYKLVACVSGRRAADARRIVSLGSMAYLGSHGSELLAPGATKPVVDKEIASWARAVAKFARNAYNDELRRLRIRLEDKESIVAFHWRGTPDEEESEAEVKKVAANAEAEGFTTHWGRKVLEIRPPLQISKGDGIAKLIEQADISMALYVGDDTTDVDAFETLSELVSSQKLEIGLRIGVSSDETPPALEAQADLMVDGTDGVRYLLLALSS